MSDIKENVKSGVEKVKDVAHDVTEATKKKVEQINDTVASKIDNLKDRMDKGK